MREIEKEAEVITPGQSVFSLTCSPLGGVCWWARSEFWIWVAALIQAPQRRGCCGAKVTPSCLHWHFPLTYCRIKYLAAEDGVCKWNLIRAAGTAYHVPCNLVCLRTPWRGPQSCAFPLLWFVQSQPSFWTFHCWASCVCPKDKDKCGTVGNGGGFQAFLCDCLPLTLNLF